MIPEWKPIEEPPLIPKAVWIAAPIVLLAAAGGYYWYTHREAEAPHFETILAAADKKVSRPFPGTTA